MNEEIEKALAACGSIPELLRTASKLKQSGYDVLAVNNEFTKRRKTMLQKLSEVKRIVTVPVDPITPVVNAVIPLNVVQLGKPTITIKDGMTLI